MALSTTDINIKVKALQTKMNPDNDPNKSVWMMSLDNEGEETIAGRVVAAYVGHTTATNNPVPPFIFAAPRCIYDKTHRIATDAEVESYQEQNANTKDRLESEEKARKLAMTVSVTQDPELMKVLMVMAQELLAKKAAESTEPEATKKKGK